MLTVALESLDRADLARIEISKSGMTSVTKKTGATHVNPLVKIERESRQLFARVWTGLHLDFNPSIDGRIVDSAWPGPDEADGE